MEFHNMGRTRQIAVKSTMPHVPRVQSAPTPSPSRRQRRAPTRSQPARPARRRREEDDDEEAGSRPPAGVLNEIRYFQNTTANLIPLRPFHELVKEIVEGLRGGPKTFRFQAAAIQALQAAGEMFLIEMFEEADLFAKHAKRVTVQDKDVRLYNRIHKRPVFTYTGQGLR